MSYIVATCTMQRPVLVFALFTHTFIDFHSQISIDCGSLQRGWQRNRRTIHGRGTLSVVITKSPDVAAHKSITYEIKVQSIPW